MHKLHKQLYIQWFKADEQNFVTFLCALRAALNAKSAGYIISIAPAAGQDALQSGYDVSGLEKCIDMFNVMTYG